MTDVQIKWALNQDWNDDIDIEASKIAEVMFEVTFRVTKEPENIRFKSYFNEVLKKQKLLNITKSSAIKIIYNSLVDKQEKEIEEKLLNEPLTYLLQTNLHLFEKALSQRTESQNTEELIRIQLAEYYSYYKDNNSTKSIKTEAEAFTIAFFIRSHTTGASKRILD